MTDLHTSNLDYLAAQHAQKMVAALSADPKKAENTITKALGVLQENGLYACFLYLYAKEKEADKMIAVALELFKALNFPAPPDADAGRDEVLAYIAQDISADLPALLLAKETLEQTLIYARYGAKAADKTSPANQQKEADT